MTRVWLKEEARGGARPRRDSKPKVWVVCPSCDKLIGFVYTEAMKRSESRGSVDEQPVDRATLKP